MGPEKRGRATRSQSRGPQRFQSQDMCLLTSDAQMAAADPWPSPDVLRRGDAFQTQQLDEPLNTC